MPFENETHVSDSEKEGSDEDMGGLPMHMGAEGGVPPPTGAEQTPQSTQEVDETQQNILRPPAPDEQMTEAERQELTRGKRAASPERATGSGRKKQTITHEELRGTRSSQRVSQAVNKIEKKALKPKPNTTIAKGSKPGRIGPAKASPCRVTRGAVKEMELPSLLMEKVRESEANKKTKAMAASIAKAVEKDAVQKKQTKAMAASIAKAVEEDAVQKKQLKAVAKKIAKAVQKGREEQGREERARRRSANSKGAAAAAAEPAADATESSDDSCVITGETYKAPDGTMQFIKDGKSLVKLETLESDDESADETQKYKEVLDIFPSPKLPEKVRLPRIIIDRDPHVPDDTSGLVEQDPKTTSLYKLLERIENAPDDFRVLNMLSDELYSVQDVRLSYLHQMSHFDRVHIIRLDQAGQELAARAEARVLQARDNLLVKLIRDKPGPPKEIAEGSLAPFKPRFEDAVGAAGGVARDAAPTEAEEKEKESEEESEKESEESSEEESEESSEEESEESSEEEEKDDDADDEAGEGAPSDAMQDEEGAEDDALPDAMAVEEADGEEANPADAGKKNSGKKSTEKKSVRVLTGFFAKGAFKMGYRSTNAERKRKEKKRLDNLDSFDAAASAYRAAHRFSQLTTGAAKLNTYKFWKNSLKIKLKQLKRIKKRIANLRQNLFYSSNKKKLQKIWDRNNYRADRLIFKMNFSVFGAQGLSLNHKGAMKFFLTMKTRAGFWAQRAVLPEAVSPPDSEYPSAESHSDVTSDDPEQEETEW